MTRSDLPVRLLQSAEDDLKEIVAYIALDNVKAANSLVDKVESRLGRLSKNPKVGRVPREGQLKDMGYRYLVVGNYLIFYVVERDAVVVHRVVHGARDYLGLL